MPDIPNPLLLPYMKLPEFLGNALGPDYEVALHDLTDKNHSIVAIANGYVSGREVGAPLTNMALSILKKGWHERADYLLHYSGMSATGKELRSNTMFIKHEGELIGMLCINFNDSRYRAMGERIMSLCHPDLFLAQPLPIPAQLVEKEPALDPEPEVFSNSTAAVALDAIQHELDRLGVTAERLTSDERLEIIAILEDNGIFLLKGTVKDVAEGLRCSKASVYRYLSQIRSRDSHEKIG